MIKDADDLSLANWALVWSIPTETKVCDSILCVNIDHTSKLADFDAGIDNLVDLVKKAVKKLRKVTQNGKAGEAFIKQALIYQNLAVQESSSINPVTSVCN